MPQTQNSDCVVIILTMHLLTWVKKNGQGTLKLPGLASFSVEEGTRGILDGILYWVQLSLAFGMLPFLALGTKYTPQSP